MERWRKSLVVLAVLAGLVCLATESNHSATGQNFNNRRGMRNGGNLRFLPFDPARGSDDEILDGVFLPPDRNAKRRLDAAEEMIGEGRFGESVRYLGSLLEGSEDFFFRPEGAGTVYRSLKAEAGRLIAGLPGDGRASYELQFGAKARRMLEAAVASGNMSELAEVSRRFFYTQAGSEASLLLARQHLDAGQPLAAALLFARLRESPDLAQRFEPMLSLYLATAWLRAGMAEQSKAVLVNLKHQWHDGEVRVAGEPVKLFDSDAKALTWLEERVGKAREVHHLEGEDWLTYRGDARRNAASHGGRPLLNPRWRVRVAHHPTIEKLVSQLRQRNLDQDIPALPSLHPLAVGNLVLMRDSRSLLAVDFTTGKLIWPADPLAQTSLDYWLALGTQLQPLGQSQLDMLVEQRVWDDLTYGTMSSDGQQVFVVEEFGGSGPVAGGSGAPAAVRSRASLWQTGANRLVSRELKTQGKLKWEIGGSSGIDEPKLAGAFFLGPPLVVQGRLYVLAEKGQEIQLVVLSAKTGKLDWSQQLCVVEQSVVQDQQRRTGGASPSFADGVLVCPTSAGAVVAVDATTRNLLWGYQYPRSQAVGNVNAMRMPMYPNEQRIGNRWADGDATIADGKVVATPLDAEYLYVLNLINGEVQWKIARGTNLYVAGIHGGNVIIVGREQVSAFPMAGGGRPVWTCPLATSDTGEGGTPSGRGFLSGDDYFLPLSSAEVIEIDLTKGQVVSRAKSRLGEIPGNLICHQGQVISQGPDSAEVFFELDVLRREIAENLKQTPDDPKALARLGEIKFDEGDLQQAIDLFHRSFELKANDRTRSLLVSSLLEGLRRDFAGSRAKASELEKLIDGQAQRTAYLRLIATGLKQSGESLAAFDAYISLLDEPSDPAAGGSAAELEPAGEGLRVRRERWIQSELGDLRAHAKPEEIAEIDRRVAARLQTALDQNSVGAMQHFLEVFGTHPSADVAREQLFASLTGPATLLERELLLRRLLASPDDNRVRAATARLAMLFAEAERPDLSVFYYRQLRDNLADIPCLDGKTGAELVAGLTPDAPVRKLLAAATSWPKGQVSWREGSTRKLTNNPTQRPIDLPLYGPIAPYLAEVNIALDSQQPQQTLVGIDGLGLERFRAQFDLDRRGSNWNGGGFNNPTVNYVRSNGNLLVVWMGDQVMAIDALRPGKAVKRVTRLDVAEPAARLPVHQAFHPPQIKAPWGLPTRQLAQDSQGRLIGNMGPVSSGGVCFQRYRDLHCVDPLTGQLLWIRKNVPFGCDVFGDDELLFVAPVEGGDALVLRALDGQLLGKRPVRPLEKRMTTIGRNMLEWGALDSNQVVSLRDAWTEETKWSHTFRPGAKGAVIADEVLGVLEQSGHFVLLRLPDGKPLVDERLEPESMLKEICLLRSSDQYLLVTNSPPTNVDAALTFHPQPGGVNDPLISGRVYAFDRASGEKMWRHPVNIQQQGLVLTQPSELPLLFFITHRNKQTPAGLNDQKSVVQVIDKRNGRLVHKWDDLAMTVTNFGAIGDHESNTVTLMLPGLSYTFQMTDGPLPPEKDPPPQPKPGFLGSLGGVIRRSLERSAGSITDPPGAENDPSGEDDD